MADSTSKVSPVDADGKDDNPAKMTPKDKEQVSHQNSIHLLDTNFVLDLSAA